MNKRERLLQRLGNQQLLQSSFKDPAALISWMGAMQAQDYAMSKWALGLRLTGATDTLIEEALTSGALIRTHVLRPTWHLVAPEDIRWMLQLTAPRVQTHINPYYRKLGLDKTIFSKTTKVLQKILRDNNQLTRTEIAEALNKSRIDTSDLRMNHLMIYAELEGIICSGARKGKQISYALLEERVPATKPLNREEALEKLAQRYFQSHGPASIKDFSWWSGLSITDARLGKELIATTLEAIGTGPETLWHKPDGKMYKSSNTILLLPNYDEYMVGYASREAIISKEGKSTLPRDGNPLFNNTLIINGKVEGTWKRTIRANSIDITAYPFETLSAARQKHLDKAIQQYQRFAGG